ncbi:V-type proton ATPase subunit D 1 [Drosophila madeirensis]|uniref:V-type proton ATPase subunit D 1 n=1 Tax=Drosophila madeirensis TaxID=30013 RepID=A0AAU9G948_DROMD|nr:V-type proton ATPase subunit D 1 [Drosophila subobscura]
MSNKDILPIYPSRANSVLMKLRVQSGQRGISLLKRKRDAIDLKLRELRRSMHEKENLVDERMRAAIFSLAKANLLGTDFKPVIVAENKSATAILRKTQQKIVGVPLNYFELEAEERGAFPLAGLCCGGVQVQKVRTQYLSALKDLVAYCSLEYMVRMLAAASRQTNMRVNALEHVVIPQLIRTYNYICAELEEFEREDFYRLKRSQAKQLEAKIAFTELIKTKNMTASELEAYLKKGVYVHPVADTHFDLDDFDQEAVRDRQRQARLERHQKRERERQEAESRGETLVPTLSSFITTYSIVNFLQRMTHQASLTSTSPQDKTERTIRSARNSYKPDE